MTLVRQFGLESCHLVAPRDQLRSVFDEVVDVAALDSNDLANLQLLDRPELGITFTKLHCWKLTDYEKCVFLDADTLVMTLLSVHHLGFLQEMPLVC